MEIAIVFCMTLFMLTPPHQAPFSSTVCPLTLRPVNHLLTVYDFLMFAYEKNIFSTQKSHFTRKEGPDLSMQSTKPKLVFKFCTYELFPFHYTITSNFQFRMLNNLFPYNYNLYYLFIIRPMPLDYFKESVMTNGEDCANMTSNHVQN